MSGIALIPSPVPLAVSVAEPAGGARKRLTRRLGTHPNLRVVGAVDRVDLAHSLSPDVVLARERLLPAPASAPARAVPVVVLVDERPWPPVHERVGTLLANGVAGVVSEHDDVATLAEALQAAACGNGGYLSPRVAARYHQARCPRRPTSPPPSPAPTR